MNNLKMNHAIAGLARLRAAAFQKGWEQVHHATGLMAANCLIAGGPGCVAAET